MNFGINLASQEALTVEAFVSSIVGMVIGAFASFIVNAAFLEVSLNSFFAFYYGVLFVAIGVFIITKWKQTEDERGSDPAFAAKKPIVIGFAYMIIASGVFCVILDKNWFTGVWWIFKIPLYMIVGACLCFAIIFAVIDFVNFLGSMYKGIQFKSLIDTPSQVLSLTMVALMMGGIYGFLFGVMDIEDADSSLITMKMMKEEKYCLLIGCIFGGLGGFLNEMIRNNMTPIVFQNLNYIKKDPFNEEI